MSRRRGEFPKKKDDTFNRNANNSRQLFNPSQHNPIAFNKKLNEPPKRIVPKSPTQEPTIDEKPSEDDEKKRKRKLLINAIRDIELKLESLIQSSRQLTCFHEQSESTCSREISARTSERLMDQDVIEAENVWKKKIELHLALAEAYLDMFKFDLEYAEKKSLESLCWKRAIYSLVDQFRRAIKKYGKPIERPNQSVLEEELALDDSTMQVPVINDDGTMTMQPVVPSQKKEEHQVKPEQRYASILLNLFLEYLDLADSFYQRLTQFFKTTEDDQEDVGSYLSKWRRTKGYKWYSCLPIRGDLARYRWSYTSDDYVNEYQKEFEEAWKRYALGIWLMPAKGNLYYNLSLLLQTRTVSVSHNFHKLYLSTRGLMVRRNGFLNARESILVLVEVNRRWINKTLESKRKLKKQSPRGLLDDEKNHNALIIGLFIKLNGMLFTKIGLDEFANTKRLFFDALFPRTMTPCDTVVAVKHSKPSKQFLSNPEKFWFETAILCLSSLYGYDYANSKLRKAVDRHTQDLFSNADTFDNTTVQALEEDVLFTFGIDITCQLAIESFKRYLDPELPRVLTPTLPNIPDISPCFQENKPFLFGEQKTASFSSQEQNIENEGKDYAWFVYIETLLQWMVLNGMCIRDENSTSFWERFISDIESDLVSKELDLYDYQHSSRSLVSSAFWPFLVKFLNSLLSELPYELHHELVTQHLGNEAENSMETEQSFVEDIRKLGDTPSLPEEDYLRGLGWVDEVYGRVLRSSQGDKKESSEPNVRYQLDMNTQRKMRILDYGFILVNHLKTTLSYDPVDQHFFVLPSVKERTLERINKQEKKDSGKNVESLYDDEEVQEVPTMIAEMDDDVLLSTEKADLNEEEEEEDDIMTQLKKRREQLQLMVASEARGTGQRRCLPVRVKEREARLNYLRERILPNKTVLVLDTNCFIGHLDHIKKLMESEKWTIIVPLVVVTELDGLATNTHSFGTVAKKAIELIESRLPPKAKTSNSFRIQTSHNSFMRNISIRSEQFMFGETDRNLDDLVLSCCLWWISQNKQLDVVPVCLVTGDINLSVKARARDVEVVPVSAIMSLTPK